jgi:hypothetical protein
MRVHLFAALEEGVTVAHCGLRGVGIVTTKFSHAVNCRDCKRRPPRPGAGAPAEPGSDPVSEKTR